jgi:hypothetical protein
MTLKQVGDILHTAPGIAEARVWHMEGSDEVDSPIKKQGGDGREQRQRRATEFRVWLHTGKKFADRTKGTLGEALREAFEAVGVKMPEGLAGKFGNRDGATGATNRAERDRLCAAQPDRGAAEAASNETASLTTAGAAVTATMQG